MAGGGSPLAVASQIIKEEGFLKMYTGLSAGVLRQITYTSARLGIFKCVRQRLCQPESWPCVELLIFHNIFPTCSPCRHSVLSEKLKEHNEGKPTPLYQKAGAGLAAGGLGAIFGSPADLSLIRMQADGTLPLDKRRNYAGVGGALKTIVKEEGVMGLFTGAGPTAVRAMALNMGMLASNDQAKEMLAAQGVTGAPNVFGASAIAGFFASFFSLPFDYVKTQLQKQQPLADGTMPFKGALDCAAKTFASGGPLKFYTGFPTFYVRIAPHAMARAH